MSSHTPITAIVISITLKRQFGTVDKAWSQTDLVFIFQCNQ